jgi:sorting nexin-25
MSHDDKLFDGDNWHERENWNAVAQVENNILTDASGDLHRAAPGDLGLAESIQILNKELDSLAAQESLLDSLIRKADLTNNTQEMRILTKSKAGLDREIRRKELQKQQYILQENDNSLFVRSTIFKYLVC